MQFRAHILFTAETILVLATVLDVNAEISFRPSRRFNNIIPCGSGYPCVKNENNTTEIQLNGKSLPSASSGVQQYTRTHAHTLRPLLPTNSSEPVLIPRLPGVDEKGEGERRQAA